MGQIPSTRQSEPGEVYRARASEEARARNEAYRKSQDAFNWGDHSAAKHYSQAARSHAAAMSNYNQLASAEIFRHHNPSYPSTNSSTTATSLFFGTIFGLFITAPNDLSRIDLHGLHVAEALPLVKAHLVRCQREHVEKTTVITGRGAHSVGGIAKIRPEVEVLLARMGMRYKREGEGAFVVDCVGDVGFLGKVWRGIFGWGV